jgi:hypothetical protein
MSITVESHMKYLKGQVEVIGTIYQDKSPAIIIRMPNGEPGAKATINVNDKVALPNNAVVIKDYSENEGMLDTLLAGKVIALQGSTVDFSPIAYIIHDNILQEIADAKERVE